MKFRTFVSLLLALGLLLTGPALLAQDETDDPAAAAPDPEASAQETAAPDPDGAPESPATASTAPEEVLTYDDFTVKGYSITAFGGQFSGFTYLENQDLAERTVLTPGAGDIMGYDGEILRESLDTEHYTGAHKEIQSGPAYGGRIGIYISDDFHLDILGTYATGTAVTTMRYYPDGISDSPEAISERLEVDRDDGYKLIKGGLALMYDATPATFFGIVPHLGFGLGGIINRYSKLPDVTGLYLEGNLGLNYELFHNFQIGARADLTNFAYDVPELGYSNMVNFVTFSFGLTIFLDTVPPEVRAAHLAEKNN